MKKKIALSVLITTLVLLFSNFKVYAESNTIIINEIAWAGSESSSSDEWIELYNNTNEDISLTGFKLEDDSEIVIEFTDEIISANSYFLIEKREEATSIQSDLIASISFANTGDDLRLLDGDGNVIDDVSNSGGAWFAGSSTTKSTMARIDMELSGNDENNWQNSEGGNSATDSLGILILGTPKSDNNSGTIISNDSTIKFELENTNAANGDEIEININCLEIDGLFSYGLIIDYDEDKLEFKEAEKGDFLSEEGDSETSFQFGLENNQEGRLVISEARLEENKQASSEEEGTLLTLKFEILGEANDNISLEFLNDSFLAGLNSDISTTFQDLNFEVNISELSNITNANISLGTERYSFLLSWDSVTHAENYLIKRKNENGIYKDLTTTTNINFVDNINIVPEQPYEYRIFAVAGDIMSSGVDISITETRGVVGDFDRSDRVDGRDLEKQTGVKYMSCKDVINYVFSNLTTQNEKIYIHSFNFVSIPQYLCSWHIRVHSRTRSNK